MRYPSRVSVLGLPVDPYTMEETLARTEQFLDGRTFAHLIGVNADKVLQCRDDPQIRAVLERCELISADGASMLLAARILGVPIPERVAGIDLMARLCDLARSRNQSVYLLGAKREVVLETRAALEEQFPGIEIVGARDGYFDKSEYGAVADALRGADPAIVFVGITSPKKEILIEFFRDQGLRSVFVGVGGAFDVVSGNLLRAPKWVQHIHCEWLFRMLQEPRRLLKRYLVGNTRFLIVLVREKLAQLQGQSQ